jgi:aminoglycoside phosphotransferase (APT) family kinase protein
VRGTRSHAADASLIEAVKGALAGQIGDAPEIEGLQRTPLSAQSSYRIELLTLRAAGRVEQIFLKDFGSCKHEKEHMGERRLRELYVYRELLAAAGLGTPEYRGSVWDECGQRFWLLLEYVEGTPLRDLAFDHWVQAARWLGRMQARFARETLSADFLVEHDAEFFRSVAESARRAVGAVAPVLIPRLEAALHRYEGMVRGMADEPRTLVHGVYRPYNILVRSRAEAGAICVTDWEESAFGSPLYDLAYLSDGFEPTRLHLLIDAFEQEREAAGLVTRARDEVLSALRCLQVHRNLKTLSKADSREGFSAKGIAGLVSRAEELSRGLT